MPAGRPTEYTSKILKNAKAYLESCKDEEYDWTKTDGDKSTSYEHRIRVKLPSIEGLAHYLKIARSTVYEWQKEHKEFSDILEDILTEQAERLMNNGLSGYYNPTISKLILTKHGYSDKVEQDVTSGGEPIPILGNLNVPTNNGDQENSQVVEADQSSTGRDISQQDDLDTSDTDTPGTEG